MGGGAARGIEPDGTLCKTGTGEKQQEQAMEQEQQMAGPMAAAGGVTKGEHTANENKAAMPCSTARGRLRAACQKARCYLIPRSRPQ